MAIKTYLYEMGYEDTQLNEKILEDTLLHEMKMKDGYENIWDGLWGDWLSWHGYLGYSPLDDTRFAGSERISSYSEPPSLQIQRS